MIKDRVSVIMPAFNCERFIHESISSVLLQTYTDLELIVVDDGSTDETRKVVESIAMIDHRVKLLANHSNEGAAVSRNLAIQHATGRFIAFLDSDDLWRESKLETQVHCMKNSDWPFTYSAYSKISETGDVLNGIINPPDRLSFQDMLKENQIGCLTAVYDQQRLGKLFMPLIRRRQDYGLWLDILKLTPYAHKVPGVLASYRIREGSISSDKIKLLRYNFRLFHEHQKLSAISSLYYLAWNIYRNVRKN